jgi:Ca2+/H+ antiporter
MNKQLQDFFDNTKQLHILLSIALLMIIVTIITPISNRFFKYSGQLIIITILVYILFKNFTETHNFLLIQKNMEKERMKKDKEDKKEEISEDTILDLKNNTIASYILCGFILILLLYVIYSMVF